MNIELKPCPFCGGEAEMIGDQYPYVECQECTVNFSANHSYEFDEDDAASKWNVRPTGGRDQPAGAESRDTGEIAVSEQQREDALDRKLSGQSKADRLIDGAAALIAGQAYELMLSHSIEGEWPESEAHAKAEHDMLLEMVGELRELKSSIPEKPDNSDHIADDSKMVKGNVALAGDITDQDGTTFYRSLLVQFTDDSSLRAAVDSGQCRFTVFGGEV